MQFEQSMIASALIVKIQVSRVVAGVASEFKEALVACINQGHKKIVLDLGDVTFIDSSGLGALIGSLKAMGGEGQLVLCSACDAVINMLKLTRMDKVFLIFGTPEEAALAIS